MKKENVLINKEKLRKLLNYLEHEECNHYLSYKFP